MLIEYRIKQDGIPVAWANSYGEIMHYAAVYRQDGPVVVEEKHDGRWRQIGQIMKEVGE